MPNADRAAVAREVLTEYADILRDAGQTLSEAEVRRYVREHYPAPPAPETVTVDGVTYERRDDICQGGWYAFGTTIWPDEWKGVALTRIASDARVLQERDARIAELERQCAVIVGDCLAAQHARRKAEAERDAALRALEEGKGEAGATVAASEPLASESPAATSPSPDPIPLGETMEVDGVKWARTELGWNGGAWRYHDSSTVARVLTALYRARHPVATRETVERVAEALFLSSEQSKFQRETTLVVRHWHDLARAALTAAGFTVQEGA